MKVGLIAFSYDHIATIVPDAKKLFRHILKLSFRMCHLLGGGKGNRRLLRAVASNGAVTANAGRRRLLISTCQNSGCPLF
jgi:hypothetical protein